MSVWQARQCPSCWASLCVNASRIAAVGVWVGGGVDRDRRPVGRRSCCDVVVSCSLRGLGSPEVSSASCSSSRCVSPIAKDSFPPPNPEGAEPLPLGGSASVNAFTVGEAVRAPWTMPWARAAVPVASITPAPPMATPAELSAPTVVAMELFQAWSWVAWRRRHRSRSASSWRRWNCACAHELQWPQKA